MNFTIDNEAQALELVNAISSCEGMENILTKIFLMAVEKNYQSIFNQLVSNPKVDVTAENNSAFRVACGRNYYEMVEKLLANEKVDPGSNEDQAIRNASSNGYLKIVELLLANGKVDPSSVCNAAIREASANGYHKIVELLLKDSRVGISNALINACYHDRVEVVKIFLSDPTNRITKDQCETAISYAQNDEIIKLLIPFVDISKINKTRIKTIAAQMKKEEEENVTDEIFSMKLADMMRTRNIKGIFIDDQGKTMMIKDGLIPLVSK